MYLAQVISLVGWPKLKVFFAFMCELGNPDWGCKHIRRGKKKVKTRLLMASSTYTVHVCDKCIETDHVQQLQAVL